MTIHNVYQYEICQRVALGPNVISYEIQDSTFINLLLKGAQSALIFGDIRIEQLFKIICSMVFNLPHLASSLSYA